MARKLAGWDKAAILLMILGEDVASQVMKNMDPKDVRQIGAMISKMSEVSHEEVVSVLDEYSSDLDEGMGLNLEGKDFIRATLTKALGQEKASQVMESLEQADDEGLDTLKWMDPKTISSMIRAEHPQTIALILAHLDSDQAGQVLASLPETMRGDVVHRMATMEEIPPGVMKEVCAVLQGEIKRVGTAAGRKVGGIKMVAGILNQMDSTSEQGILSSISQTNADLAEQIRQLMFVFDDLLKLDDRAIQEVLKEVSKEQLSVALKAAKEEIREKIFKNMSTRAAQLLKDDIEAKGPIKLSDVEKTQQEILKIVRRLVEEGKIMAGGKGEDAMV